MRAMNASLRIAHEEWRLLARSRAAVVGLVLLLLLSAVAAFTAWEGRRYAALEREGHQAQVDQEFDAQPDRHPHRMVHYGHFVFRPLNVLAAFDAGIEPYTGHTLFLEGHRQNSANFGEVRQSSLLMRFGQLTPAFVLQVLAPLLLVFIGHAVLAREQEAGLLLILLAQGVRAGTLVLGKLIALGGVALLLLLPAWIALAWMAVRVPSAWPQAAVLAIAHAAWLLLWVLAITAVSALAKRGHEALLVLLAVWVLVVVLVPRLASASAANVLPLPTRFETDIAVAKDLAALGDSHNADDPYYAKFRQSVLARYGVSRIEDLPVNYKGLVGMEGERLTSELFARYGDASYATQFAQSQHVDAFALLSPAVALRRLSIVAADTDLRAYRRFTDAAEAHRYRLVQSLNRMQAEQLTLATDKSSRDDRIDRRHWHGAAVFELSSERPADVLRRALPAAWALGAWLMAGVLLLCIATHRMAGGMTRGAR